MADNKKFIDLDGLKYFHDELVERLAANSASKYTVNYAVSALGATNDGNGKNIASTYLSKDDAAAGYVAKTSTIAGIDLQDNISAADLAAKLPLIASVTGDGVETVGQNVTIDLSAYATKDMIATVLSFKGVKPSLAEIEAVVNPTVGDLYVAQDSSAEYVYIEKADGSFGWEPVGSLAAVNLEGYYTSAQVDAKFQTIEKVNAGLALKADKTSVYTKDDVNTLIEPLATKTALNGAVEQIGKDIEAAQAADKVEWEKADAALKTELKGQISGAKTELEGKINAKLDASVIEGYYTKGEVDSEISGAVSAAQSTLQGNINLVSEEVGKINTAIAAMDLDVVTNAAGFIRSVAQADGKVTASATAFDTEVKADSNIAPTSAAVATYVGDQIIAYDAKLIAVTNEEIDGIFA